MFDLPNVYSDTAQAQAVINNFKDKMEPYFEGTGLKLGVMFPTVFRYMSSNKAVRSIDDFKVLKAVQWRIHIIWHTGMSWVHLQPH